MEKVKNLQTPFGRENLLFYFRAFAFLCLAWGTVFAPACAQTWLSSPSSGDWNTGANWSGGTVPNGPAVTAAFGASAVTAVSNTTAYVTLGGLQFNSGASSYVLTNNSGLFVFQDSGVVDASGKTQQLVNDGGLLFQSNSTAGDLAITGSGSATFTGSSTAGQASVANNAVLEFDTNANAGHSSLNNAGFAIFINSASVSQATLVNSGTVSFGDNATAGSATLINNGNMNFSVTATGGNATITNNSNLSFRGWALAGNAAIQNSSTGTLSFYDFTQASAASITNNGTVAFNNNSSAVGAVISNSHILDFNDFSTAANANIANSGILNFTGSSTAGAAAIATNNGGRTVFEQGTTGGAAQFTTNSGGVLDASGVTTGTLTVGSYTQVSGGTLEMALGSGTPAVLAVTGNAALAGSLSVTFGNGFSLAQGNSVTLITTSTGSISGKFDQWTNPVGGRLFPFYQPTTLVYLESVLPTFQVSGLTSNEKAVGTALDAGFEDTKLYGLMRSLVGENTTALPGIYDRIDPSGLTSLYQMGFRSAQAQAALVFQALKQQAMAPGETPVEARSMEDVRFAADMPAGEEKAIAQNEISRNSWKVSLNGYGGFGTLAGDGNSAGYPFTVGGLTASASYRLGRDLTGGFLLGYSQGTANPDGGGEVDLSGGQLGLYAGWHDQGFHAEALAEAGLNQYKIQQASYGGTASGTTGGEQYSGQIGLGYNFRLDELKVGPFASVEYTYVALDSFNESGSNAPLAFFGQGEGALLTDLGLTVEQSWQWGAATLNPGLTGAWEHAYQANPDNLTANLGSPSESFTVQGPATGQDALVLGIHMDVAFKNGWNFYGEYQGRIGLVNYTEQGLACGVKTEF